MNTQKPKNKLFRLLTAAIFLFTQLNPAWAALTTHSVDADFAGAKLRISDTDTTSAPKLEAYYQESPADPYTVGLWHFDGNANDSSGKSHTGTLVDTATVSGTTQFMGNVLTLDGAGDCVSLPDSDDWYFGSGDFSVSFWIKYSSIGSSIYIYYSQDASIVPPILIANETPTGKFRVGLSSSTVWDVAHPNTFISTTAAVVGKWYHVAVVRDGSTARLFINGIVESTVNVGTATLRNDTAPLYIGSNSGSTEFVNGSIDELRILKGRALTPEEIKAAASRKPYAVYTSPAIDAGAFTTWDTLSWSESGVRTGDGETPLDATGLVASWNFNESSGTTASNGAGPSSCGGTAANCNGTLTNFASTASQDQAAGSGWTANNKKWGAGALMFDGVDDYVSVLDSNSLDLTTTATIEAWVRSDSLAHNQAIVGRSMNGYFLGIYTTGRITWGKNGIDAVDSKTTLAAGKWYHIVAVRTESINYIYINGILDNSGGGSDFSALADSIYIGEHSTGADWNFTGIIDSTRVYSRALSASEILSNYNAGNIEIQTRTGATSDPNDGSWEAWKPTTSETQLLSMDSDKGNWNASGLRVLASSTAFNYTGSQQTYTVPTGVVSITIKMWGAGGGGGVNVGENGGGAGYAEGILSVTPGENLSILVGQGGGVSGMDVGGGGGGGRSAVRRGSTELLTAGGGGGSGGGLGGVGGGTSGGDGAFTYKGYGGTQIAGGAGSSDGGSAGTQYTGGNARSGGLPNSSSAFGGGGSGDGNSWEWYGGGGGGGYFGGGGGGYNGGGGGGSGYIGGVTGGKNMAGGSGVTPGNSGDSDRAGAGVGGVGCLGSQPSAGAPGTNGRVIIYTAISNPANELNIKMEGTGSLKVETGKVSADPYTVALWHFEETSGTGAYIKDATANANHATPTGTTVVDGIFGKARKFNGTSDYVSLANSSSLQTSTVSIMEWVKKTNTAHGGITAYGSGGWGFYITAAGNLGFGKIGTSEVLSTGTISDTNWHLVAVTYDTTTAKFYIDGSSAGSPAYANPIFSFTTGVQIGQTPGSTFFQGTIDEVSIFNRVLSADEIAETYRMGANHRISRTITSADLSGKTKLPFYVAADRPGTYLEATIGESANANYYLDNSAIATNTVLFLHGDEIAGSTAIKDSSLSGKAITANGNARTSGNGKIGNSVYFDGTGDYLSLADSDDWNFGGGDFTWDFWMRRNSTGTRQMMMGQMTVSGTEPQEFRVEASNKLYLRITTNSGNPEFVTTGTLVDTTAFHHIAIIRYGNTIKIYIDGIADATSLDVTGQTLSNLSSIFSVGRAGAYFAEGQFDGWLDEVRIIKGTALTPDQIRQAYEYGLRSHPITIDFAAKLDSANLISGSGDTSFTVDATAYGLSQKGANLYPGDKIIVRENVDGTEYISQGTVSAVTASSGAVTVASWDSGATFPASGFSANASVFKWQREYFDLSGSLSSQRDAITNLTIRPTNGAEGRTIYLDDFRKAGDYLTAPASSTIESTANRYLQYRAIVTTSDPAVSPSLTGVTVNNTPLTASYLTVTHNDYSALAGDVETITITAKDVNGNVVPGYAPATTVSITKTESGSQAASVTLSSNTLLPSVFIDGVATLTLSDTEAENVEITATDSSNTAVNGTSLPIVFAPAVASKIVWTSSAQTLTANIASAAYTVAVRDQYDNLRSADALVLDLASSSAGGKFDTASGGAFNGTVTSITTSGGTGTFYYKDTTVGSPTLTVSKTGLTSATQVQTVNFGTVSPTVTSVSYKAGAITNNTIAWTSSALPQNGKIELDFPVGYDLSGTLTVSGNTNATVSVSGNTLVITLGTAIAANSPVSLEVSGIKNPLFVGSTGAYALRTKDSASALIDEGTASANTLIAPVLNLLTPSDTAIKLYAGQPYEVTWSNDGSVSNNLYIYYSSNGGVSYLNTITVGETNDGVYAWTVPYALGTNFKIKIEDVYYQPSWTATDVSANTFEITLPEIIVSAPGNAESDPNFRWIAARSYEIKWKTRGKTSESWTIEGQWLDDQAGLHTTAILDTQTTIANSSFDGTYYHYTYTWTISDTHTLTNSAYIRITAYGTDVNNAAVTDSADSEPYFKIVATPQIALVEPISGAEWFINSANTIKWTMTEPAGDSNNKIATLQYAADSPDFANWVTITAAGVNSENSQNSFSWTIDKAADLPAGAIKLKVFDNAMASTTDTTAWSFKISNPAITVSAPLSGQVWRIGSTPEIQWSATAGVSSEVKIEYFDGTNWNTVIENEGTANDGIVSNDGGFVWTVPNIATLTAAKIRISDAQAGSATYYQATIESAEFEIAKPLFSISLPAQSPLRRGGSYTFNWTDDGTMGSNLDVLYAPTGTSFSSIKTQGSFSQDKKSFTWSVPIGTAVPQTNAKFQVKDNSSPFGEGTSLVFSVDKQRLTFDDSTVSGVSWPVGSQHTIGWSAEGEVTGVYIYYYKGASNIATVDQTANNNALPSGYTSYTSYPKTYSWTIANDDNYLASGTAKVKISAKTPLDAAVISTSAAFTVREPYLTVSLPSIVQNSGKWVQGDSIAFNWSADGYLTNNGQLELAYAALSSQSDDLDAATWVPFATVNISGASVNSGSFDFRPSDYSVPAGSLALQVRDTNANRPLSKGRSTVFEISTEPYIGILAPLSVPAWRADTDQVIQWQGAGSVSSALKIEYSTDNNTWSVCKDSANVNAENLASIGSFSWRVPAAIKDNTAYIRIMDTQRQVTMMNPTGISAAIKGISLTDYPGKAADESFTVGGTKTITWSPAVASSAQALVKIESSTDSAHNTWSPVTESEGTANDGIVSDDGSFDWIIPDALSATAKIRVGSVSGNISAASDNDFKIIGSLEVSAPAASANWIIGTTQTVSWNALQGTFANVKLQYSPDNGATWKSMSGVLNAATTVANNGAYSWTIPDNYSATAKARIYEENGLSNTAESSLFTIASPQISISQPSSSNNGNSALTINEPYDLEWTTTGSTGTNNLELKISYDNQANWSTLEADWPNTSPKSITPTSTSVQAWVKISEKSTTHPGAVATAGPFTVLPTPQITLSSPALNSAWTMGKQYEIKWDTQGLVFNTLRISYTLDGSVGSPVWVDITSGQSNTKSFYWTVSDLTSTLNSQANAKIRIIDDTKGTVGYSDLFTISIPSMSVVRPQGGEVWAVGDSAPVKWSYNGAVIGPLSLQYDASGVLSDASPSIVANASKTGQTSGTYTYNWSVPSGAQTSSVKARVKDSQRPNSSADSAASFEVIAAPTIEVTSPVDGDVFVIQDAMTVNWKVRGLSADSLSVEYWDDANLDNIKDAGEQLYTLVSGVSRGATDTSDEYSGKYTGTKTITLPDNAQVSANLKLRLRDPARGYEGLAVGHFRIRGGFELRDETNTANALASSSEWKANTSHTIKWYNKGSFANVKLEYAISSNGTSWGTYTSIIATLANSPGTDNISSYSWTVPDPHLSSYPDEPPQFYYVKLKITNLADTSVFTESPAFKIGYYTVTWKVKDYDTLTLLDSLTVSSTYSGTTYWRVNNGALTSTSDARYSAKTYPRRYPYGVFSTFWSKDGYGERSDNDRTVNADMEVTLLLESAASAQTEYKVYAGFAYNEDTDKLKINSWLEKKGTLITSADADVGVGGDGYIKLYDGETLAATLSDSSVDSNGNYWFEASNVVKSIADGGMGLTAGKTYFAKMGIWYRSREYQSGASFEVTISKSLKAVTDEIKTMSSDIKSNVTGISSTVAAEAAATRSELKTQLESGTTAVKEKLASEVSDLKAQTAKILTAAETTIPEKINSDLAAAIKSDVKPHIKSGILNRDNVVKTGQSLTIRYRTETGKSPAINIYNSKNALMVSGTAMTEVSGTGIYEYNATFTASWGTGDFSVICSESSLGTVDAMVITVIKHTLDEVAGMTSSVMGSTSSLSDFKGMGASLVNIDAQFKALDRSLSGVGQNIINKVSETKGVVSEMESVYNQLSNLSAQIKSIGATKNVNLEKLYEVSQEKKEDIIYLKNKAEELKAVMEINKKMTENVAKKPVVQSWFEYR